jgi:sugar (pentulose or hexulose) kinase
MDVSVGVDIGTTNTKILVASPTDEPLAIGQLRSEWFDHADGAKPEHLIEQLLTQIELTMHAAQDATREHLRLIGVGLGSLAESGVLVNGDGEDATPIVPWYDTRGEDLLGALPADFRDSFPGITGLPLSSTCTFAKLLWFRSQGIHIKGTWLSLGEYVAYRLTGQMYAEPSLASRTGLFDQDTGAPFEAACQLLGTGADLLPAVRWAGVAWGHGSRTAGVVADVPITVAGHDHLVAAFANGIVAPNDLFNSSGTADALVQVLPKRLSAEHRAKVVERGWSHGWHVVPGKNVLLGGTRGGLVLRRVLDVLGPDRRDDLDRAIVAGDLLDDASVRDRVTVSGASVRDATVVITLRNDSSPVDVWAAALQHTIEELATVYSRVSRGVGDHGNVVAAGGWTQMESVWLAKKRLFPSIRRSHLLEAGATGAAILGRLCSGTGTAAVDS